MLNEQEEPLEPKRGSFLETCASYVASAVIHALLALLLFVGGMATLSQFPAPAPAGGASTYVQVDIISDQTQEGIVAEVKKPETKTEEEPVAAKNTEGDVRVAEKDKEKKQPEVKSQTAKKTGETGQPSKGPKPPGAKPGDKANVGMGTEGPGHLYGKPGNGSVVNGSGTAITPFPGGAPGGLEPVCSKTDRNVGTRLSYVVEFKNGSLSVTHIGSDPKADTSTAQNTMANLRQKFSLLKLNPQPGQIMRNHVECSCGDNDCRVLP
jgi:hypothetical protein